MPDSYGKRQRNAKKARKFAEREERRQARKQQRADREAGVIPAGVAEDGVDTEVGSEAPTEGQAGPEEASEEEARPKDDA